MSQAYIYIHNYFFLFLNYLNVDKYLIFINSIYKNHGREYAHN